MVYYFWPKAFLVQALEEKVSDDAWLKRLTRRQLFDPH
jgi:hypothetical protein